MKFTKIKTLSVPGSIILSALIISISIFLTGWFFLNDTTIEQKQPTRAATEAPARLTPEQIKKIQEERAAQMQQRNTPLAPTNTVSE